MCFEGDDGHGSRRIAFVYYWHGSTPHPLLLKNAAIFQWELGRQRAPSKSCCYAAESLFLLIVLNALTLPFLPTYYWQRPRGHEVGGEVEQVRGATDQRRDPQ
jgi:hypothetical protein